MSRPRATLEVMDLPELGPDGRCVVDRPPADRRGGRAAERGRLAVRAVLPGQAGAGAPMTLGDMHGGDGQGFVRLRRGETFEELYRRFKRGMDLSGILRDHRRQRRFTPNHELAREKRRKARRRAARGLA
jgi:ribosomal protein S21